MKVIGRILFQQIHWYIEIPKGKGREEAMRKATDEIMCRIGIMLPEKYRGVYAEHPRLKELLARQ